MAKGDGLFWVASTKKATSQIYLAILKQKRKAYITKRWRLIAWIMKIAPSWVLEKIWIVKPYIESAFLGCSFLQLPVSLEDIRLKAMIHSVNSSAKLMPLALLIVYIWECLGSFQVGFYLPSFSFTQKSTFLSIKSLKLGFMDLSFSMVYQP